MARKSKVHYLMDGEESACGALWEGSKEITNLLEHTSCKKCLDTMADVMAAHMEEEPEEEPEQEEQEDTTDVIYTLAPVTLDKIGSRSMGASQWLYKDDNVPEQSLRKVVVYPAHVVEQLQAYRLKVPYITFTQKGLEKAQAKGLVYRKDEEEISPIVAGIDATIATIENAIDQTAKEITMAKNTKTPKAPTTKTPTDVTQSKDALDNAIIPATKEDNGILDILRMHAERLTTKDIPQPSRLSALDAILAAPIGGATLVRNPPPQKALPLPEEKTEDAIVAAMNPGFAIHADMYKAFVQAFKQALKEEGLVIVPAHALVPMEPGCGEEEPKEEPKAHDPIGDAWGSMMDEPKVPAKPKSTLVLGPNVPKAPKAPKTPAHDIPGNNGKVPVDTIIAIQTAWKNKTATQAELAVKYGMDPKKVWFFCNRSKSLI